MVPKTAKKKKKKTMFFSMTANSLIPQEDVCQVPLSSEAGKHQVPKTAKKKKKKKKKNQCFFGDGQLFDTPGRRMPSPAELRGREASRKKKKKNNVFSMTANSLIPRWKFRRVHFAADLSL